MNPTPAVLEFLVTVAEQWGPEWGLALARAMRDGVRGGVGRREVFHEGEGDEAGGFVLKTTFYIQFEGKRPYWDKSRIGSVHALRMTQTRPTRPMANTVVVKMTADIPVEAFLPFEPTAEIVVPLDRTQAVIVEVEEPDAPESAESCAT